MRRAGNKEIEEANPKTEIRGLRHSISGFGFLADFGPSDFGFSIRWPPWERCFGAQPESDTPAVFIEPLQSFEFKPGCQTRPDREQACR